MKRAEHTSKDWQAGIQPVNLPRTGALADASLTELAGELAHRCEAGLDREGMRSVEALTWQLQLLTDHPENRFSPRFLETRLIVYHGDQLDVKATVDGETIVEFGAGSENPLGALFGLQLLGASRCYAVEPTPLLSAPRQAIALADVAFWMAMTPSRFPRLREVSQQSLIERAITFPLSEYAQGRLPADDRLVLLEQMLESLPIGDGEVDRTVSTAFLEHVGDVDVCLSEMARVTKPGGIGVHMIDLSDHGFYSGGASTPIDFLLTEPGASFVRTSNRLRQHEWDAAFDRHGFDIVKRQCLAHHDWQPEQLARRVGRFARMAVDLLTPIKTRYVVRRRG